ncbi:MAG: NUDIX domain-containing protein [Elusimicrobia bacterium]|nr:NUDIX domain-containing protein [Elusimicrobiota bacterium]
MENLRGEVVWTFPKGHLEKGETPRQAALREVEEETGWRCRIKAPLTLVRYHFTRKKRLVSKRVRWYTMEAEVKRGEPDADEVLACRWTSPAEARRKLRYPGDQRLVDLVSKG